MKRIVSTLFVALIVTLSVSAIRPIHMLFPVKQSDGSTVMLYTNGDGYLAFYTTEDNKVVLRDDSGTLCYAEIKDGKLVASAMRVHNIDERTSEERAFVEANTLKPADAARIEAASNKSHVHRVAPHRIGVTSTTDGLGKYNHMSGGRVPSIGKHKIPVLLVEFADVKFQPEMTVDKMKRFYNKEGYNEDHSTLQRGSVRDYFVAQSNGMFIPDFDVVAKVTLSKNCSYYGKNSTTGRGNDLYVREMIEEGVKLAVEKGVDFSDYYYNGIVPNINVIYAGYGEATGGGENTIWPHELDLTSGYWPNYEKYATFSGYKFGSYFVGNELYGGENSESRMMGMGVLCHEFGHALGLPDFYVTDYSYDNDSPFGGWDIMDTGAYANSTYAPVGYTAYEKSFMGWLDLRELNAPEAVTLADPNTGDGEFAVLFRNPSNVMEYFILENRQTGNWFPEGNGLLISHYTFNQVGWSYNTLNNDQAHKRALVVTANGAIINPHANEAHLWGNSVFNKTSFSLYDGTELTTSPIYKITKHNNRTLTFNYKDATLSAAPSEGEKYYKVTDVAALEDNDQVIIACEEDAMAMGQIQTTTVRGAVPVAFVDGALVANDDVQLLTLKRSTDGKNWGFRATTGFLAVTGTNANLKTQNRGDANAMTKIDIADGNAVITFQNKRNTNNKLGYSLENTYFVGSSNGPAVQIYSKKQNNSTAIQDVPLDAADGSASAVYNLAGQRVNEMYKGVVIKNGKKLLQK